MEWAPVWPLYSQFGGGQRGNGGWCAAAGHALCLWPLSLCLSPQKRPNLLDFEPTFYAADCRGRADLFDHQRAAPDQLVHWLGVALCCHEFAAGGLLEALLGAGVGLDLGHGSGCPSYSRQGLTIVDTISESKSAKAPGRIEFNRMLERIRKGEATGILCWKLNRLARNPIDGGQISWMLQQNTIQSIQTYSAEYKPTDNVLMMAGAA